MYVVIPSARDIKIDYVSPLIDAGATIVVVDDTGEKTIKSLSTRMLVLYQENRRRLLGNLAACIPHKNGACRDLGLWYAYAHADQGETIVCLDDDCEVTGDYYMKALQSLGYKHLPMLQTEQRFYNPIDLYTLDADIYHRGFPYEERNERHDYTYNQTSTGEVIFNLGLWAGAFDVNAVDKLYLTSYRFLDTRLKHKQIAVKRGVLAPLSSMNMILKRELIPAIYQLPMNESILPNWVIDRYGDIWGGYICKKLIDVKGDLLSIGEPIIVHHKEETLDGLLKNIRQEHCAHLVNLQFCSLIDAACERIRPSDYLTMYEEFVSNLKALSHAFPIPLRNYLEPTCRKMEMWVRALRQTQC